jgi:AcrR family transcriptional regulator
MNREEKNRQTRRKILDSALAEFSRNGYKGSSVNTICSSHHISKGIIYHYFDSKDDLYLACVTECFQKLTDYLDQALSAEEASSEKQLENYFSVRMTFFQENPIYQPIFCEAIISPPEPLLPQILSCRKAFDDLTISTLTNLLRPLPLKPQITICEIVEIFQEFQDFINAKYHSFPISSAEFEKRDHHCRKILKILLYGVVERSEH